MSRRNKRLLRLFGAPPPTDFKWSELLSVMTAANFSNECNGGSHYMFEHTSGFRFFISKTHPSGILRPYQIRDAKEALQHVGEGLIGEQDVGE
jgi:hypothetical protein